MTFIDQHYWNLLSFYIWSEASSSLFVFQHMFLWILKVKTNYCLIDWQNIIYLTGKLRMVADWRILFFFGFAFNCRIRRSGSTRGTAQRARWEKIGFHRNFIKIITSATFIKNQTACFDAITNPVPMRVQTYIFVFIYWNDFYFS